MPLYLTENRVQRVVWHNNLLLSNLALIFRLLAFLITICFPAVHRPYLIRGYKVRILEEGLTSERASKDTDGIQYETGPNLNQRCRFSLPRLLLCLMRLESVGSLLFHDLIVSNPDLKKRKLKDRQVLVMAKETLQRIAR
jgi:hypothetical protein